MPKYTIIRTFQRRDVPRETVKTGLTLAQAQAHCQGDDSSSATCTTPAGLARTARYGSWSDKYTSES